VEFPIYHIGRKETTPLACAAQLALFC